MNGNLKKREIVVITGGNSGVGLALAQRLLSLEIYLTICLACRNVSKAEVAKEKLKVDFPAAVVDIVQLDTSSVSSVNRAAKELQKRYSSIDYLYLNAGTMPSTSIDWSHLPWLLFHPSYIRDAVSTGEGLIQMVDGDTEDGLKLIFATNLYGHFHLVKKLENILCSSRSQIVWTSSSNARKKHFNLNDLQHKNGAQPYSSSKYAINLLSIAVNEKLGDRGVRSHVISPGFSVTAMTTPLLSDLLWTLLYPIFILLRLIAPTMCVTPWNSAEALVWFYVSDGKYINPEKLHTSCTSVFGKNYIMPEKIEFSPDEPSQLYQELEALQARLEKEIIE
ncbi:3-keto-steroid reductase/17-beta-hydroxysteroid dehydrogenase 7-like isoform X2 [Apostichopus japonicus]|uniref:3-keto-steroid reductase/17-beta-hydroxysteroid dehydrogenase 7-like isoform X2 n=1 Tax=Stichopus japonicus TaxID=307972 RepID=UPI003AB2AC90